MAHRILMRETKYRNCKWCGSPLKIFVVRGKFCCFKCMEEFNRFNERGKVNK